MAWDNTVEPAPGDLYSATDLQQIITNWKQLKGQDTAQTQIDLSATLVSPEFFKSTHASSFDLVKQTGLLGVSTLCLAATNADTSIGVEDDDYFELYHAIGIVAGARYDYGHHRWDLTDGEVWYRARGEFSGFTSYNMTISPDGKIGILFDNPEYELDVGAGVINISGSYRQAGTALTDWTETLGPPDRVDWTGPVKLVGSFTSTVATGTAPLVVASTTECTNLDVEYLAGYGWHPGIQGYGDGTAGTSDTASDAEVTLNRVGKWFLIGWGEVWQRHPDDDGLTVDVKIKTAGGTQIGATAQIEFNNTVSEWSGEHEIKSAMVFGAYTSGSGTDVISITYAIPTATGLDNLCTGRLCAIWLGP